MTHSTGQWFVLVEENIGSGENTRWQLTQWFPANDQEHALTAAQDAAFRHRPEKPFSPKQRSVWRTLDGGWVVTVQGAMTDYHFRVSVAEWYGEAPG